MYDNQYKKQYNREPPKNVKSKSKIYKKHLLFGWQVYENMAPIEIDVGSLSYINSEGLKVTILKNELKFCNYNIEKRNYCISVKIDNKPALSFGIPNYLMFELSNIDEKNDWVAILNADGNKVTTSDMKQLTTQLASIDINTQKISKDLKKIDKTITAIVDTP